MQDRALIATRKGLFELFREKSNWTIGRISFLADPVTMPLFDRRDGTLYAALNLGHFGVKMHRRDAGSETWKEIASPAYPQQPQDHQDDVEWKLKVIWSLATGGPDEPGVLWAGTLPGGLFRSRDRGDSWELIRSLWDLPERKKWAGGGFEQPGIHSICVDPRNSRHVTVGVSCGGVWATRDGGDNWKLSAKGMRADYMPPDLAYDQNSQDPHQIVQCSAASDVFWCQHHNGIFRSTDGSASWHAIERSSPNLVSDFGFAVAVHPHDAQTAWFVPGIKDEKRIPVNAALCVSRTRDGGKTFEALRDGLPQKDCYDLIYRHGLAVSDDGNTLLMGSTTGGLWITENGGDTWQEISHTLPPVYAVRFF